MVILGSGEEGGEVPLPKSMAMGPKRSMPLHNFSLPCLKWGSQRYMKCTKTATVGAGVSSSGDRRSLGSKSDDSTVTRKRVFEPEKTPQANKRDSGKRMRTAKSRIDDDGEDGIEAVREKLMLDLKTAADRMKDAILRSEVAEENEEDEEEEKEEEEKKEEQESPAPPSAAAVVRPWNLRTRRAACKSPAAGGSGKGLKIEEKKPNCSALRTDAAVKSPKLRSTTGKRERVKFSVQLSRKEVDEDFMELLGHRPPRRPKKRPRIVQKQLDTLFPGLWLTEVTADSYN